VGEVTNIGGGYIWKLSAGQGIKNFVTAGRGGEIGSKGHKKKEKHFGGEKIAALRPTSKKNRFPRAPAAKVDLPKRDALGAHTPTQVKNPRTKKIVNPQGGWKNYGHCHSENTLVF